MKFAIDILKSGATIEETARYLKEIVKCPILKMVEETYGDEIQKLIPDAEEVKKLLESSKI